MLIKTLPKNEWANTQAKRKHLPQIYVDSKINNKKSSEFLNNKKIPNSSAKYPDRLYEAVFRIQMIAARVFLLRSFLVEGHFLAFTTVPLFKGYCVESQIILKELWPLVDLILWLHARYAIFVLLGDKKKWSLNT